jgi:hypothetical protein
MTSLSSAPGKSEGAVEVEDPGQGLVRHPHDREPLVVGHQVPRTDAGLAISIPDLRAARLIVPYLREGRLPETGRADAKASA